MRVLLLLVFDILSVGLFGQYKPTIVPGNTWEVSSNGGMGAYSYGKYFIQCDTFINDLQYYIVQDTAKILAFVREDTTEQRIYRIDKGASNEKCIFDFKLSIGDTFLTYGQIEKDTVMFYMGEQRRFKIFQVQPVAFVEGVGITFWGIYQYLYYPPGIQRFYNTQQSCAITTNISQPKYETITIHPNPFKNEIVIPNIDEPIRQIFIYSSTGNLVFQSQNGLEENTIFIDNLPEGLYYISINEKYSAKIMKL